MVSLSTIVVARLIHLRAKAIVYALYDLCDNPHYIEALRDEINLHSKETKTSDPYENMILLENFLKESARFSPSDSSKPLLPS